MTSNKNFLRVLGGEALSPPPVWLMRQAGRYLPEYRAVREKAGGFLSLCMNPELASEVTLQPVRRFGVDAAILFADILLIPHAMGQRLEFQEGEGPVLEAIDTLDGIERLDGSGVSERLAPVFETVRRTRAQLASDVALIGFAGAPWTVATYMIEGRGGDQTKARALAWGAPKTFERLMAKLVDATVVYLGAQVDAGADAIQLFDTWAGALPPSLFEAACFAPTRAIVSRLKTKYPGLPIVGFPRGLGAALADYVRETGVDGVGLDTTVSPIWARERLPAHLAVQGNLDPALLIAGGEAMRREAQHIVRALAGRPHIFNLGHGVTPQTPPDHVAELIAAVRSAAQ